MRALLLLLPGLVVGPACGRGAADSERQKAIELLRAAEVTRRAGDPAGALASLERARASARDASLGALFGVGIGEHLVYTGEPDEGARRCEEARATLATAGDAQGQAMALVCVAEADLRRSRLREAEQAAATAVTLAGQAGDKRVAGRAVERRAASLFRTGRPDAAVELLERAAAEPTGDPLTDEELTRQRAIVASGLGRKKEARAILEPLLASMRARGDRGGQAALLTNLAGVLADMGERRRAVALYEEALPHRRAVGDRAGEGATVGNMGLAFSEMGDKPKALALYEQALPLRHQAGDRAGEASTLNNIGIAWAEVGEQRKAIEYYQRALPVFREIGDQSAEAGALVNLGGALARLGERRQALERFGEALPLLHQTGDRPGEATTLGNLGLVHAELGEKEQALRYYEQALPILRQVSDRTGEGRTLNNIGLMWAELFEYRRALEFYEKARPLRHQVGDRAGEASTLNNMGIVHAALGDPRRAVEDYQAAAELFRATGDRRGEAGTENNIGLLHAGLGEGRLAAERYQRALALFGAIGDHGGQASALTNLGLESAARGDARAALGFLVRALPLRRAAQDRAGEATTLGHLARLLAGRGQRPPARAVVLAKQAVNLYQSLRADIHGLDREAQRTYGRAVAGTYRLLADLLAAQGRLGEAQQALGLLKDQEFFEFVRRDNEESTGKALALDGGEQAAAARYEALAAPITRLGAEWSALQAKPSRTAAEAQRFAELDRSLQQANEAFAAFLGHLDEEVSGAGGGGAAGGGGGARGSAATAGEGGAQLDDSTSGMANLLDKLEPGTVAIYTLAGEQDLRTILVTRQVRKGYTPRRPLSAAALGRKVLALREALQDPRQDPRPQSRELYEALIGPMEADLAGAQTRTILWLLDGPLRYLPMAALHDGKRWVAERWASVVITGDSLAALQSPARPSWTALALGVTAAHQGFSPLPGVADEIEALVGDGSERRGVLPGRRLLDGAFTESALTDAVREGPAVIHVASHFAFKPGDEARSFLLLGDGSHLTLGDLRRRPRIFSGVDLLALSACETAVQGGEGAEIDGLARIAQKKGAAAVLATLWPVSDASTPALMRRFYELRESRTLTKAEALRLAQVELASGALTASSPSSPSAARAARPLAAVAPERSGAPALPAWRHPFYWAPFILLGNGR